MLASRSALRCASCGTDLPPAAKFCLECGRPVSKAGATAEPGGAAEAMLAAAAAPQGEHKLVTVLFAGLKGSMELVADRDPEEARKLLDPVLEHMCEAVEQYGGTLSQIMGDGIKAPADPPGTTPTIDSRRALRHRLRNRIRRVLSKDCKRR